MSASAEPAHETHSPAITYASDSPREAVDVPLSLVLVLGRRANRCDGRVRGRLARGELVDLGSGDPLSLARDLASLSGEVGGVVLGGRGERTNLLLDLANLSRRLGGLRLVRGA